MPKQELDRLIMLPQDFGFYDILNGSLPPTGEAPQAANYALNPDTGIVEAFDTYADWYEYVEGGKFDELESNSTLGYWGELEDEDSYTD